MEAVPAVGQVLEFDYPRHNYHLVRSGLERRRLLVEKVRDLSAEPLDQVTIQLDPELRRGRLLVTGQDLDKRAERSFYLESMLPFAGPRNPWLVVVDGDPSRIVYEAADADEANAWADDWNSFPEAPRAIVANLAAVA